MDIQPEAHLRAVAMGVGSNVSAAYKRSRPDGNQYNEEVHWTARQNVDKRRNKTKTSSSIMVHLDYKLVSYTVWEYYKGQGHFT